MSEHDNSYLYGGKGDERPPVHAGGQVPETFGHVAAAEGFHGDRGHEVLTQAPAVEIPAPRHPDNMSASGSAVVGSEDWFKEHPTGVVVLHGDGAGTEWMRGGDDDVAH